MSREELSRKEAFFRQFESLCDSANVNDEQHDQGMLESMLAMQRGSSISPTAVTSRNNPPFARHESGGGGRRILPAPYPSSSNPSAPWMNSRSGITQAPMEAEKKLVNETPLAQDSKRQHSASRHQPTDLVPSTVSTIKPAVTSKGIGKRKRLDSSRQVPAHQKIFNGLRFFFVPNNDISRARRMRIHKAIDYGAEWAHEWHSSVTHIIADKYLTYMDVTKYLGLSDLPADVILVNDGYIAECISYQSVEMPILRKFHVQGHDQLQIINKPTNSFFSLEPVRGLTCDSSGKTHGLLSGSGRGQGESTERTDDALGEAITQAKATSHLPLDSDNEDDSLPCSDDNSVEIPRSPNGSEPRPKSKKRRDQQDPSAWQMNFQCMQDHQNDATNKANNPNMRTIDTLQEMESYYRSIRDQWRTRAYRMAIATLRKQDKQITSAQEAETLPFIGPRLAAKIEEIVWTNKLQRLEDTKLEPCDQAVQLFLGIYGVGFFQASTWAKQGYTSLADLAASVKLTPNQKVGIDHHADFCTRIPRVETARLGAIVTATLHDIDPAFSTIIGGSFRRGAQTSGDIDILITKPDAAASHLRATVLETLVPRLQSRGFLVATLAATARSTGSKWHGACQLPLDTNAPPALVANDPLANSNPWRSIDLLLVPPDELGVAMIYFTGNDIFNRSMRLLARRKGMRLNQGGLYKDVLRKEASKSTEGTKIEGASERAIFEALGVPWREAWERAI